jgi:hypothetical protein
MLTPNEVKVIKALLKYSKPTKTKNYHECNIRLAFFSLKMPRDSFAGSISALKRKGLYNYVIWESNPNKKGYKDYPAKKVLVWHEGNPVGYYKVRSDIALIFFNKNYLDRVMIEEVG